MAFASRYGPVILAASCRIGGWIVMSVFPFRPGQVRGTLPKGFLSWNHDDVGLETSW